MQSVSGFTDLFYRTTNPPEYHCHYTSSIRMPTESVMPKLEKGHREQVASDSKDCFAHLTGVKLKKNANGGGVNWKLKSNRGHLLARSWTRRGLWAVVMASCFARVAQHLASKALCLEKFQLCETAPFCHPHCWFLLSIPRVYPSIQSQFRKLLDLAREAQHQKLPISRVT